MLRPLDMWNGGACWGAGRGRRWVARGVGRGDSLRGTDAGAEGKGEAQDFFFLINFYLRIVALRCCISFYCTVK